MSDPLLSDQALCLTMAKGDVPQVTPDQYLQSIHLVVIQQPQDFISVVTGIALPVRFTI